MSATITTSLVQTQTQITSVLIAAFALIVYDYIITFKSEILTVWRWRTESKQAKVVTFVTLAARGTLLFQAAGYALQVMRNSSENCHVAFWITAVSQIIGWAQVAFFIAVRIRSLCRARWIIPVVCFVLGFVPVLTNIAATIVYRRQYVPQIPGCVKTWTEFTMHVQRNYTISAYVTCFTLLCRDSTVLVLTLHKTYKEWREAMQLGKTMAGTVLLYDCFLRHGAAYFSVILVMNVAQLIIFKGAVAAGEILNPLLTSVPLILTVRFTMNVRELSLTRNAAQLEGLSLPSPTPSHNPGEIMLAGFKEDALTDTSRTSSPV